MDKLELTPNQIYFCTVLMEQDYKRKKELFKNYFDKHGGFDYDDIERLEEKGYIANFSNSKVPKTVQIKASKRGEKEVIKMTDYTILDLIMVTPLFREEVYIDAEEAANEFIKAYPTWISIKDKATGKIQRFSIKSIPDREEFIQFYQTITNGDIIKHKLIVEMAANYKKFVEKGAVAGTNIRKALESRFWEQLEELIELEEADKDGAITSL
jgi:hypothetical protein